MQACITSPRQTRQMERTCIHQQLTNRSNRSEFKLSVRPADGCKVSLNFTRSSRLYAGFRNAAEAYDKMPQGMPVCGSG